jgi:hypothetical protein
VFRLELGKGRKSDRRWRAEVAQNTLARTLPFQIFFEEKKRVEVFYNHTKRLVDPTR